MTPMQRHRARHMAASGAVQAAPGTAGMRSGAEASAYQLQLARLGVDLRRLREIQSRERKIDLKRDLLPGYVDWIDGTLAADTGAKDEILTHIMIWRIDVGDFAGALPLARYVLRHRLPLPERFERTPATLIVEEIAEAALHALGQGNDFDLDTLVEVELLGEDEDMPDEVRAKLMKAIGLVTVRHIDAMAPDADGPAGMRRGGIERARDYLSRALALNNSAGVKKDLDRLERELKKSAPAEAS